LIIVPASLRKQWSQELIDKFYIDSIIIDGKSFKEDVDKGKKNPFNVNDKIVICSYHFAYNKIKFLSSINWDLVTLDEAHKLRNVYKKDNTFPLDRAQYYGVHRQSASFPVEFIKTFGYDDVLLINEDSQVYFTSLGIKRDLFGLPTAKYQKFINDAKEKELSLNLKNEPLANTGLAKVWKKVLKTKKIAFQDFSFYTPDNKNVLFVGAPIFEQGSDRIINIIVLKILSERFDWMMKERTGMGKTGIFLLLGKTEEGVVGFRNNITLKTEGGTEIYKTGEKAEEKYLCTRKEDNRHKQVC